MPRYVICYPEQHQITLETNDVVQKTTNVESENKEWEAKYGKEAQQIIRETVDANIPHYEYLKQYCIKV
jgi:hypothetical protein